MSEAVHFQARAFDVSMHWTKFLTDAERLIGEKGVSGGLYRFYDSERSLLYVGQTLHFPSRWVNHKNGSRWWPQVAYVAVSFYPRGCPVSMQEAEKASILIEQPEFNGTFKNTKTYDTRSFMRYLPPPGFVER